MSLAPEKGYAVSVLPIIGIWGSFQLAILMLRLKELMIDLLNILLS